MRLFFLILNLFFLLSKSQLSAEEMPKTFIDKHDIGDIFSYLNEMLTHHGSEKTVQGIIENYLGDSYLTLVGYYDHPLETGVAGFGEVDYPVRVTFINGILNQNVNCVETAKFISDLHGGVNIHYVYRPTEGWAHDLMGAVPIRFGFVAPQSVLLAKMWKELIDEMGGVKSHGFIIHYGHSIGASDTWNALTLLSDEEKKMIKLITFGSPLMIEEEGVHSVTNYVSVRDGVPVLDPFGCFKARQSEKSEVIFVGSFWDGLPFIDHTLTSPTYYGVLTELGKDFVATFGRVAIVNEN